MINEVWFKLDEALPPLDEKVGSDDCNCSIIVALVLKSGMLVRGFRYYESGSSCWAILDQKDTELSDNEIAGWSKIPSF